MCSRNPCTTLAEGEDVDGQAVEQTGMFSRVGHRVRASAILQVADDGFRHSCNRSAGSIQATRLRPAYRLVRDYTVQTLGLFNPALDLGLTWRPADELLFRVDVHQFLVKTLRIAPRQVWHGVDAADL